jgi:polyphosphate glucokinase
MNRDSVTFAIDVGGTWIKSLAIDPLGNPRGIHRERETPRPATPDRVVAELLAIAQFDSFDRVSIGFPGLVCVADGIILTAPNLDGDWSAFGLASVLEAELHRPVRVAKDADVHGFGAVSGKGVEMLLTLGTGLGSSLFMDGRLVPNLDLGHHPLRSGQSYEQLLGKRALERDGKDSWRANFLAAIRQISATFNFDALYVGGGHAALVSDLLLPEGVRLVSNMAGLTGCVALWDSENRPGNWRAAE